MTGLGAAILYCKVHKEDKDWCDIDDDIVNMIVEEELDYDVLEDTVRMRN